MTKIVFKINSRLPWNMTYLFLDFHGNYISMRTFNLFYQLSNFKINWLHFLIRKLMKFFFCLILKFRKVISMYARIKNNVICNLFRYWWIPKREQLLNRLLFGTLRYHIVSLITLIYYLFVRIGLRPILIQNELSFLS